MSDEQNVVGIDSGTVRGTAEGDLLTFKGVPFADPPVGASRWRAPQPATLWDGVRGASAFGHDPMQLLAPGMPDPPGMSTERIEI